MTEQEDTMEVEEPNVGRLWMQSFAVSSLLLSLNSEVLEKAQLFSSNVGVSVTGLGSKAAPVAGVFYKQVLNKACLRALSTI